MNYPRFPGPTPAGPLATWQPPGLAGPALRLRVHLPPGPGPGTEQLCQWGGGLASRAGLGGAGGRGLGRGESPHLRSHPASAHAHGWAEKVGGPPRPPHSTPSPTPSDGRFGVPKHILQGLSNRQPQEGPEVGISAPGSTRRAGQPLSLNKGRCRAHELAWPCGQPQALATHEAGWPSRPVGTGWPRKVLLQKLNAQPEISTPPPAQSSLVRSCHMASPPTEAQEVPTTEPGEWRHVGSRGDDTTEASRNVPITASAPQACSPGAGTPRAATPTLQAPGWGLSVCSCS